jgi:hypothetical protein
MHSRERRRRLQEIDPFLFTSGEPVPIAEQMAEAEADALTSGTGLAIVIAGSFSGMIFSDDEIEGNIYADEPVTVLVSGCSHTIFPVRARHTLFSSCW